GGGKPPGPNQPSEGPDLNGEKPPEAKQPRNNNEDLRITFVREQILGQVRGNPPENRRGPGSGSPPPNPSSSSGAPSALSGMDEIRHRIVREQGPQTSLGEQVSKDLQ